MISKLEIKNFKAFGAVSVEFSPLTLLMGENGSGKSTIIQSILLSKQILREKKIGSISLNGEYIRIGNGRDALFQGADEEEIHFNYTLLNGKSLSFTAKYSVDADILDVSYDIVGAFSKIKSLNIQYLSANRVGPQLFSHISSSDTALMKMAHDGSNYLGLLRFSKLHLMQGDPRIGEAASRNIEAVYDHYISKISSGAVVSINEIPEIGGLTNSFSFSIEGQLSFNRIRPTNVGFGLSYIGAVIVSCLIARKGDIVIIENPEAHLHTKGQRAIADLLARTAAAGVQVIRETHSREILYWYKKCINEKTLSENIVRLNYISNSGIKRELGSLFPLNQPISELGSVLNDFIDNFGGSADFISSSAISA